ncbi:MULTISPECIES: Hsp20/alpha crystallin family protein [Nitrosomonas]|uniref:Heat shock protein Hsp20 n=2 Tax=Nitrosomonas eutropha TaxID=916 RepID=A0ABX5MAJ0_9PROT|nr:MULTISPECIES: Hsp20/alpha crystallin family protein [Nitrosomonas]ABI59840.1 heat shock protein Hsp20 [Nitrosomonas eutropha C91]MXS80340.1 Hsp20/alpha crystallin family protein [Nitrosomonas sp. GH22]PXV83568.1 heat shock protein Hsp20 [Nitrosomonas eutropha]SCW99720.1 heat shock protein Hsp20 [Nitrosomonas eutropha]SDW29990.1 heat shock protein Hsp20 [Nitrosomonas eutropha]
MAITRYEPWGLLSQLQRELGRVRDDMATEEGAFAVAEWAPAVDIKEEEDKFVLHADLPGVKPEAIEITTDNGMLTIKGEKQTEAKVEKEGYKRVERTHGSFFRRFSLPDTADLGAITAVAKDGVLVVTIPKREAVRPKKIAVSAE